jgi:hypothetical protein
MAPEGGDEHGAPAGESGGYEQGGGAESAGPASERPAAEPREFHAESSHDPGPAQSQASLHFEPPVPRPPAGGDGKPFVVWSSAPADKDAGRDRGE